MAHVLKIAALATLLATTAAMAQEVAVPSFAKSGELSVCVDPTFPPMEYFKEAGNQEATGFDIDFTEALAGHWNAKAKFVVLDFTGILPGLEARRCDIAISGITIKQERLQNFSAVPYLKTSQIILARTDSKETVNAYEDLSGKLVAAQAGTTFVDALNKANENLAAAGRDPIKIQSYPKGTDVIQQILNGRVVGGVSLDSEFAWREIQSPGQMKIVFTDPRAERYGAYLRKNAEDEAAIRSAVDALQKSGELARIAEKYKLQESATQDLGL